MHADQADPRSQASALDTIPKLVRDNARRIPSRPAMRQKEFGIWQSWTWAQANEEIRAIALGLLTLGLKPGERVAIIGENRPRLYWSMVAAQSVGAIPVPLYQDAAAEEMQYVLEHSGAAIAVVQDQEQVDKVLSIKDRLPELRHMVYDEPRGLRNYDHTALHDLGKLQAAGRAAEAQHGPSVDAMVAAGKGSDTCVMLYTSGTTGKPKGVVLSNDNIVGTARASLAFDKLTMDEEVLAYLPMAWVGDFIFSMGQANVAGFCVSCPESPATMMSDLREIGPTYFFAPPRVFEGLLTNVMIRMEDAGKVKKRLFDWALAVANRVGGDILDGRPVGLMDRIRYALGNVLIYAPLKNSLGMSRIRIGYTAGEAIGPEIFKFYRALGINLKQLYGQTEASVFITQQPDGQVSAETVGVPSPGVEIRINENGEVLYRSAGVFQEYYKNPTATAETKTPDGWVFTGDAGYFDDKGHLRIIDRAKDVGKMADGTLFAPKYVENKLKFYPAIQEAVVFGAGRENCTAFINIDLTAVGNWAERNNVSYASYQELAGHDRVYEMIAGFVAEVNKSLASDPMLSGCQISRFLILHKELDADDGELTRTRKVRRRVIADKYSVMVDALYGGQDSVYVETAVTYEDGRQGKLAATVKIRDAQTYPRVAQKSAA